MIVPTKSKVSDLHAAALKLDARHKELSDRVARLAGQEGINLTGFAPLAISRAGQPSIGMPAVCQPSVCIVVQGRKSARLGEEVFYYDPLNYLVVSVTLPVVGQVIEATPEHPYLCIRINLDAEEIGRMLLELKQQPSAPSAADRGLFVARVGEPLLDAVLRLVRLLDTPADLPVLAPIALREIYYRLLTGELGHRLIDLAESGGNAHRIARAIDWLKQHYAAPLRIEDLAAVVHMSPSALHHRFKAVSGMSPLQFQKQLRLHEARRLMFADGLECAAAGHRVGYESPSQFSREYRRLFGAPPRQEIAKLREAGQAA
ncbi:AraC family transcriptional regulator [Hydrocarboniphaga sp.]|uniref:AraC family transcriptional regulator n=1 Tax=Hydrocarboniphaga sp. TaxID=2033016 RepID=UPI00261CD77D|nr:AraC family transcriptional regulator [Hydrocarboniphaga sp.]